MLDNHALFTTEDCIKADKAAIEAGTASEELMQNAASACVEVICELYLPCPTLIVCGHGNNGGDGKIISEMLKEKGWQVQCSDLQSFASSELKGTSLIIDAIFGTGLNRPVEGGAYEIISQLNESNIPIVSVDISSGINATTGEIMGIAACATHTISFVRPKLGQILLPGKAYSGNIHVADIGIDGETINAKYLLNNGTLWQDFLPVPSIDSHKYTRGHTLVMGGQISSTGASRLASYSALRIGSGLVSVTCTSDTLPVYATSLTAVMTKLTNTANELEQLLEDPRINAILIGPGYGLGNKTHDDVLQILKHKKPCVLDADAITAFKNNPQNLFSAINAPCVLTPHEGEFSRIFKHEGSKVERAGLAAKQSGAVIVLKGNDTVIAAPDGRITLNANAPPWLATAGSGDVLAGMITGLLAQNMPAFEAACAAVWIHGQTASELGYGMIAEDLTANVGYVMARFMDEEEEC